MTDIKKVTEAAIARIDKTATARQKEAAKHYIAAREGDLKSKFWIQEGISTSDIPSLLAPAINVQFLTQYAAAPRVWDQVAERFEVDSFDQPQWGDFTVDASALAGEHGGDTFVNGGLPRVGEYDEYPAVKYATTSLTASLSKAGVRARLSWEAILKTGNVDLIGRFTDAFGLWSAQQEDIVLAKQFAGVGAVNTTNWTAGRKITGDPSLTVAGLEKGLAQAKGVRVNGNLVTAPRYALVTTPALSMTARNVLSITNLQVTDANGIYDRQVNFGDVFHVEMPFIAAGELGANALNAYWWLVPVGGARPAFLELFLSGHASPLVSIKDSGHFSLGGGAVPSREGSFEEDDVQTRVRHVVEAAPLSLAGAVYSEGDNA